MALTACDEWLRNCVKDAGDDPDVTNGLEIGAVAEHTLMQGKRSLCYHSTGHTHSEYRQEKSFQH